MPSERPNNRPRGPMGPGPRGGGEKAKNFKVAIKKLTLSLRKYWILMVIAFILAAASSVLTIMAPNRLSKLTDELTKGLVPNTEELTEITNHILGSLNQEELANKFREILNITINEEKIKKILMSDDYTAEEKKSLQNFSLSSKDFVKGFSMLSANIQRALLEDSVYNGVTVSIDDKLYLLNNSFDENVNIEKIPDSIKKIVFPDTEYKGITLTTNEQINFLLALREIDENDQTTIYSAFDKMPSSIYNLIKPIIDFNAVKKIVLIIACLYGFTAMFSFIVGIVMVNVANNYARGVRNGISKKINKLPLKYFDTHTIGDILSRVTNDIDTVAQSMNQSLTTLVSAIAMFVGSIIMMFYTNALMAITAIVASLIGFILMFIILGKSQKYFTQRQIELGNINGHIEEIFSGHNVVKLYNGKKEADRVFDDLNEKVYICERKSQFLSGLMHPIMGFIGNFGYVAVCIVGAILTLKGTISFGVIIAFMIYIRLFTNPLSQLAQSMTSLQSAAAASERVFEFLEEKEMDDESHKTMCLSRENVKGEIIFDHVKFGYEKNNLIIKDFSAHIKPGQKIAIVGPTGAGKTTLVNLLMRFYEINSGDIKIDGVSTKDLTRDNIHNLFIMVLQDTWLFNGTIRDNIRYNKEYVIDEEIMKVCKVVGVEHYIKTLPNGLDSEITDANAISSGQKQLLTIARGMIEDAPFLILDEATSNVDTRTEELVQKAMDKLTVGRTSFIIAHRLSTIKNADLILVMNEGNIIETGNHEELMKQNGFYANLYNSQFDSLSE